MKVFLFLSSLILSAYFEACVGKEDYDIRFEKYLNDSLAGFPNYLIENDLVPCSLPNDGKLTLQSEGKEEGPIYNFTAEFGNRFYHGAEKHLKAHDSRSNLSYNQFSFEISYGDDGQDHFVEGQFSLNGTIQGTPFYQDGKFTRRSLLKQMGSVGSYCLVETTDEGYFQIIFCLNSIIAPPFQNFTMDGVRENSGIHSVVAGWYNGQVGFADYAEISYSWMRYITEKFAVTPIADIIGDQFAPKVTTSNKGLRKIPKFNSERFFDMEKNEWRQKVYVSYESN